VGAASHSRWPSRTGECGAGVLDVVRVDLKTRPMPGRGSTIGNWPWPQFQCPPAITAPLAPCCRFLASKRARTARCPTRSRSTDHARMVAQDTELLLAAASTGSRRSGEPGRLAGKAAPFTSGCSTCSLPWTPISSFVSPDRQTAQRTQTPLPGRRPPWRGLPDNFVKQDRTGENRCGETLDVCSTAAPDDNVPSASPSRPPDSVHHAEAELPVSVKRAK